MFSQVDEQAWLRDMRKAATGAIDLAAGQLGDPDAAKAWTSGGHTLNFDRPSSVCAALTLSRPDAGGEVPMTGQHAIDFDYLPYAGRSKINPLFDQTIRAAVLLQIRGRARDAEIARLSPGEASPAWACTLDVLSFAALSHFLPNADLAAIVSDSPPIPTGPDDNPTHAISREWLGYGSNEVGLHLCHLVPHLGAHATDGIEFRLGGGEAPRIRMESSPHMIHVELHGVALPETAIASAEGWRLSRFIDDPALKGAADLLTVRSIANHVQGDMPILSIVTDEVRTRCAAPPEGATFEWETLRDSAAAIPRHVKILPFGTL